MLFKDVFQFTTNRISAIKQIRCLNLQEYQSKQLLRSNGCLVQNFFIIDNQTIQNLDALFHDYVYAEYVVKAQILAGGRGKGYFIGANNKRSGVFITKSCEEAKKSVIGMSGKMLVTDQTESSGVLVDKVMVAESVQIKRESYLSILMDPANNGPVIIACPIGGVNIEELAKEKPHIILKQPISIANGVTWKQCKNIAHFLGFQGTVAKNAEKQIKNLYDLFIKVDATQIEINPFVETDDERVFCVDAKLTFDDNAFFRQKHIFDMETFDEMDIREIQAKNCGLHYIGLDGNIACLVNGAGLAMATMDIIKLHGGVPSNFLDVGGSATEKQVYEAFKIITTDSNKLRVVFINIFGGIMRCDLIARGVIKAFSELGIDIPVVMRLKGTNVNEAKKLIQDSSLLENFQVFDSFDEAAKRVVELAQNDKKISRKKL